MTNQCQWSNLKNMDKTSHKSKGNWNHWLNCMIYSITWLRWAKHICSHRFWNHLSFLWLIITCIFYQAIEMLTITGSLERWYLFFFKSRWIHLYICYTMACIISNIVSCFIAYMARVYIHDNLESKVITKSARSEPIEIGFTSFQTLVWQKCQQLSHR